MSKTAIARIESLTHEEWLKLRKKGIGGSDAAAVCGINRWRGPLDIYLDKTSDTMVDNDNEAMYWGRVMEPVLRGEFARRSGLNVETVPFMFCCKEYPFMLANIDGIVHETDGSVSLLELKTANGFAAKEWENGLPQEYYLQVQHYLFVTDLQKAWIGVLIGGNNFRYFQIDRDEETIQMMIALESEFWSFVEKRELPPMDEQSANGLSVLYPKSDSKSSIILPEEADNIINGYMEIKHVIDELKPELEKYENQLKAMMKTAALAQTNNGYTVKWQTTSFTRLDTTRLKKEKPEIVAEFSTQTSSRRFSITESATKAETASKAS